MARKPPKRPKTKAKPTAKPRPKPKKVSAKAVQGKPLPVKEIRKAAPEPQPEPIPPTLTFPEYAGTGRPPELTPERHMAIINARKTGLPESDCAALAGVSKSCVSKWKKRGEKEGKGPYFDFFNDLRLAAPAFKMANLQIINDARKSDWRAAKALLEMTFPEEYKRQHHKHAGDADDPTPIGHQEVPMSDEEIKARALRARQILDEAAETAREILDNADSEAMAVEDGEDVET